MPLMLIELRKGRTVEQKQEFARRVTDAAEEALDAPRGGVRLRFIETDDSDVARGGVYAPPEGS
jgi:4-oxalocrotonate tautomerase family enzyme